ncbi:MAG: PKD domain-containing protein [Thermodesulfobacteriota bacterium]
MNHCSILRGFLFGLVFLSLSWVPSAFGRLYPPCPNITYQLTNPTTVQYSVVDPVSGQTKTETWVLSQGDERFIESVQADQGLLTWIARYKNTADAFYTYDVHYRIYDPGRGMWKAGNWGVFAGYNSEVSQLKVKDGVVAWKAHRRISPASTSDMKYYVCYAAYDPAYGSWVFGYNNWQISYNSPHSPENLRVQDGVVAWPMNPVDEKVWVFWTLYDFEVHRWVGDEWDVYWDSYEFDWVYIENATVHFHYGNWYWSTDHYSGYDQANHKWKFDSTATEPWAYFTAQPNPTCVPSWVCLWDLSLAMNNRTGTTWNFGDGGTSTGNSPVHQYTTSGNYYPLLSITTTQMMYWHTGFLEVRNCPPSGNIQINGGDAYTNSRYAVLSLQASAGTTQMRFRNPMDNPFMNGDEWLAWESFSSSRIWYLISFFELRCGGTFSVTVQYRDAANNLSPEYEDTIILDYCPPSGSVSLNGGNPTTCNPRVTATWSASDDYGDGVSKMRWVAFNKEDAFILWTQWQDYQPTTMTIPFSSTLGHKTALVEFMDFAGNISQVQGTIELETKCKTLPFLMLLLGD